MRLGRTEITDECCDFYSRCPFSIDDIVIRLYDESKVFIALGEGIETILRFVNLLDPI